MQETQGPSSFMYTRRLFLALLPDQQTTEKLTLIQQQFSGKRVPVENFHLTLMFLGDQPESRLKELKGFVENLPFQAFDLAIDQTGLFSRLKIGWAGPTHIPAQLTDFHETIWNHMVPDYVNEKKRPFRPHITLSRNFKGAALPELSPFSWHVSRLALMESIISREIGKPAFYQILAEKRADSISKK